MSEQFLASAEVRIHPDLTSFRTELLAGVTAASKGVAVPIPIAVAPVSTAALTASQGLLMAQQQAVVTSTKAVNRAQIEGAAAARTAARATREHAAAQSQLQRGAAATALSLGGVRGATLAASGSFLAGAAAVAILAKSVSAFSRFETELNVFRVTAEATADEMDRVRIEAQRLGRDITLPGVAAGDAAETMSLLARAGLDVEDSMAGARGTLQLATAAEIANADAAQLAANALNAFGLAGEQAEHVADLLAGAANSAQGTIGDMGLALQQSAAAARQVGLTLEDTVALLTILAREGLSSSDAGTSLRTALIRLVNPTEKANRIIERLNLNIRDTQGNIRPEVFAEFGRATERLSAAERDRAAAVIFGNDAFRAQGILARQGTQGLNEARAATNQAGEAARTAGARTEGFAGDVEALSSNLETLGGTIGRFTTAALSPFVFGLNLGVGGINSLVSAIEGAIAPPFELAKSTEDLTEQLNEATEKAQFFAQAFGRENIDPGLLERIDALSAALEKTLPKALQRSAEGMAVLTQEALKAKAGIENLETTVVELPQALDVQFAVAEATGASDNQLLGILRQQEAKQQAFLDRMLARPQTKAVQDTVKKAAENLKRTQDQIQGILDAQANAAKSAAADAARAQGEADQAVLDSITGREDRLLNAAIIAAGTTSLQDDIRTNLALRSFYKRSIEEVRKTVTDAKARAQAIAGLTRDLITANQEVRSARQAQREEAERERQERQDARLEALNLNLELAVINENEAGERRALAAIIRELEKRIAAMKGISNKERELRNELARRRKQLKELRDEAEEGTSDQQRFFDFLQTQQGFAANLFGNLIPLNATAGLVGTPQPPPERGVRAAASVEAARDQGVTPGQFGQLISIQEQQLRVLIRLAGGRDHPEAVYQRRSGGAAMDIL